MFGSVLICFITLSVIFAILWVFFKREVLIFFATFFIGVSILMTIGIPVKRLNSLTTVEKIKVFQETLNFNRKQDEKLSAFERTRVIETVNKYNNTIAVWKTKGKYWYNNKWLYHPSTQYVEYVK